MRRWGRRLPGGVSGYILILTYTALTSKANIPAMEYAQRSALSSQKTLPFTTTVVIGQRVTYFTTTEVRGQQLSTIPCQGSGSFTTGLTFISPCFFPAKYFAEWTQSVFFVNIVEFFHLSRVLDRTLFNWKNYTTSSEKTCLVYRTKWDLKKKATKKCDQTCHMYVVPVTCTWK